MNLAFREMEMEIQQRIDRLKNLTSSDEVSLADICYHEVVMATGNHKQFPITEALRELDGEIAAFCTTHWSVIQEANANSHGKRGFSHPRMRTYCLADRIVVTIYNPDNEAQFISITGSARGQEKPGLQSIAWSLVAATEAVKNLTKEFSPTWYTPDEDVTLV